MQSNPGMEILPYDEVDPLDVLHLNLMSLEYPLTPERAATIRRLDARPFPFYALYAMEDGHPVAQVSVYRLPAVSVDGAEDVGGISAVCSHPAYAGRGYARLLMEEAERRMVEAGLRFSTLGTSSHRSAYPFYLRLGYTDVVRDACAFAAHEVAARPTGLKATHSGEALLRIADEIYARNSPGRLGFAGRAPGFIQTMVETGELPASEVWLVWQADQAVGYALAHSIGPVIVVSGSCLDEGTDLAEVLSAMVEASGAGYVQYKSADIREVHRLRHLGYRVTVGDWGVFMVKPLVDSLQVDDFRRLFGVDTPAFLISWIDIT